MKKIFTLIVTLVLAISLQARDNGQFFKQLSGQNVSVTNVEQRFGQWFSLPEGTEWREVSRTTDFAGMERIEYRQYVAGVEVEHSQVLIHAKDGRVISANGMVMESRRAPARIRQHRPMTRQTAPAADGREIFLVNTPSGFRYAYKQLSAKRNAYEYYDAETQELLKRVPLTHRLSADDDEEGNPVEVAATSLYSGDVTLDACQLSDGSTYLYDSKRNIHTLSGAYIPTIQQLAAMGKLYDYFPQLDLPADFSTASEAEIEAWAESLGEMAKANELDGITKLISEYTGYVGNKAGQAYTAYRIRKVTFDKFMIEDEDGNLKPFTPVDLSDIDWSNLPDDINLDDLLGNMAPLLRMNFNYGTDPESPSLATVTSFNYSLNDAKAMPYTYEMNNFISTLPRDGVTLYVLTPQKDTDENLDDDDEDDDLDLPDDDDDDDLDLPDDDEDGDLEDDDDEDDDDFDDSDLDDEEEVKYDTLAVTTFVPDGSGKFEFSNERMTFTIEYEKAGDPVADIHWGMAQTLDYYKDVFGRESYDGQGSPVYNLVYNLSDDYDTMLGMSSQNAAALSSQSPYPMMYGLGSMEALRTLSPVVELSVMAHEYTHIITDMTAKLEYQGESGALNESFSDIMGISVKKHVKKGANWLIAEGVVLNYMQEPYTNMRDMANPKNSLDGKDPSPDTYEGEHWVVPETDDDDNGGVHTNSGVQNKWYYLLTDGGSGTNDKGTAYDVTGIGIDKAQRIAYLTLTSYATMESDYAAIREASLEATTALYGASGQEAKTVADAWDAVGVAGSPLTSIEKMYENECQAGRIFDLQGRRLPELPTESGIYIVDGQKVIVK